MEGAKLYKVCQDEKRDVKKMVKASTMEELIEKGLQKLQKNRDQFLGICLQDGTEVDEEEVFEMIPNQELIAFKFNEPSGAQVCTQVPADQEPSTSGSALPSTSTQANTSLAQLAVSAKDPGTKPKRRQMTLTAQCKLGPALEVTNSDSSVKQYVSMDVDHIKKAATIYTCKGEDKMTRYHKAINEASFELCKRNPSLIGNKQELLRLCREKLDKDGYQYKKGKSRTLGKEAQPAKKANLTAKIRQERIGELKQDLKDLDIQISLHDTQREKYTSVKNFQGAIDANEHVIKYREERRRKNKELIDLSQKEQTSEKRSFSRKKNHEKKLGTSSSRGRKSGATIKDFYKGRSTKLVAQSIASRQAASQSHDVEIISSSPESSPSLFEDQDQYQSGSVSPVFVPTPEQEIEEYQSESKTGESEEDRSSGSESSSDSEPMDSDPAEDSEPVGDIAALMNECESGRQDFR